MRYAADTYGSLHLAVNNAGIRGSQPPAGETDPEAWDKVIAVNLDGVYIETPLLASVPDELRDALVQRHPLGRLGGPEEVAHLMCFLLSEEASFITGGYYLVDGGSTTT